jgi:hypothetical protein
MSTFVVVHTRPTLVAARDLHAQPDAVAHLHRLHALPRLGSRAHDNVVNEHQGQNA